MSVVFVTGGTGYLGRLLLERLIARGREVHALARAGSVGKLPSGAKAVLGNALDATTFAAAIPGGSTIVHLVGTPHPSPAKAAEFLRVDLASIRATCEAAMRARAEHLGGPTLSSRSTLSSARFPPRATGRSAWASSRVGR